MSNPPVVVLSDQHCHSWSAFSTVGPDGVNSRLRIILDEILRAAKMLLKEGGSTMILCGDLFHVRGSVRPSVMNPVQATFAEIAAMGITVIALAGNHDLEDADANELGNAMQSLGQIAGFHPVTSPTMRGHRAFLPWYAKLDDLREQMAKYGHKDRDCFIHAPVNGVIKGLPDIGLTPQEIATFGFNRVFVGHFHNHVYFPGNIWSVGATTHQTWSDPDTLAGFMMVYDDHVEHHLSHAPSFVDLKDPADITPIVIKGNYVRLKLVDVTEAEIKSFREELIDMGALGVQLLATKKTEATRAATITSGATLEASVNEYIEKDVVGDMKNDILAAAVAVIMEARSK
jgi:energy-converting hydrogenase Eha subunit E